MRLKANHLTALRLLFIPFPCAFLMMGPREKLVALLLFLAIGITDYFDGYLARKHGPTFLGAVLDPIADKIFILAMFIPLGHQGIVPLWMVWIVVVREFAVTELRILYEARGISLKTSELAKYKTSIQMIGGGVIILIHLFGDSSWVFMPLGALFLFTVWLFWYVRKRSTKAILRAATFLVLVAWATSMRGLLPYQGAILAIMGLVCASTVLSGIHYMLQSLKVLRESTDGPIRWSSLACLVSSVLLLPSIFLGALVQKEIWAWPVLGVLGFELAIGGLTGLGASFFPPNYARAWPRVALVNALGIFGTILATWDVSPKWSPNFLFLGALLVSLWGLTRRIYENRRALVGTSVLEGVWNRR